MSGSKSRTRSDARGINPDELTEYFTRQNELSGGRLNQFAKQGTGETEYGGANFTNANYTAARPRDIKALGGLGATQLSSIATERQQGRQETAADPSLSIFQRQRSNQLSEQDLDARADAIRKETEAQIGALAAGEAARKTGFSADQAARRTGFSADEAGRKYQADVANRQLTREDLATLADIFFGGLTTHSKSKSFTESAGIG